MAGQPNKIFLQIGINDLAYGDSREIVLSNYKILINLIQNSSPNSKIYICSIFSTEISITNEIKYCNKEINSDVQYLNNALAKLINISFVDCYDNFSENSQLKSEYTSDGIHLNGKGYLLWSSILKKHLE